MFQASGLNILNKSTVCALEPCMSLCKSFHQSSDSIFELQLVIVVQAYNTNRPSHSEIPRKGKFPYTEVNRHFSRRNPQLLQILRNVQAGTPLWTFPLLTGRCGWLLRRKVMKRGNGVSFASYFCKKKKEKKQKELNFKGKWKDKVTRAENFQLSVPVPHPRNFKGN